MKAPREAEGPPGEPAGSGAAGLVAAPGAIWLCGDVHGRFEHLIDAVLQPPPGQRPAAIVLLGDVQASRPLERERPAVPRQASLISPGFAETASDEATSRRCGC